MRSLSLFSMYMFPAVIVELGIPSKWFLSQETYPTSIFSFLLYNVFCYSLLQASECLCEELVTQVPESTMPLLRQVEAIQISCLRTKQTQLSKSLENERQKAAKNRQGYLARKEEADTHKGHVNKLIKVT